jgi:arylsulfatase A-like enzyme
MYVQHRLFDVGEDVTVAYPAMEELLKAASSLPGVGWNGMRDREVASKFACAWVGRGQFRELVDCRPAFLAPVGTRVTWDADAFPGDRLKTAVTVLSSPGSSGQDSVRFRVVYQTDQYGEVLYDSVIAAVDPVSYPRSWWYKAFGKYLFVEAMADREYWVEVLVDIPKGSLERGILRFETLDNDGDVFPFWAEARLLRDQTPLDRELPDVVFFMVDAVQARLLEDTAVSDRVLPNLSKLKDSGVYFRTAITNGNWTRPSIYSMFASRPHSMLGTPIVAYSVAPVEQEVYYKTVTRNLITEIKRAGYTTVMLGNNAFMHGATSVGMDMGFDRVWDVERDYYDTIDITEMAIRYLLRDPQEAVFLFVNYNAPHYSYKPPFRYTRKVFGKDRGDWRVLYNQYLGEIRYSDEYLGRVVRSIDKLGQRDQTLFVMCADHGEVTRRHPVIRKCAIPVSSGTKMVYQHGRSFFDDELRVPLMFSWEGKLPEGRGISGQVQLMDVTPTVLDLLELDVPEEFQGKSLMPMLEGRYTGTEVVFSESRNGISMRIANRWKYARRFPGFEAVWVMTPEGLQVRDIREELYDLQADPMELCNLIDEGHPMLDEIRNMFDEQLPDPVWVYRMVLPDSVQVQGEVDLGAEPMLYGSIGEVDYTINSDVLRFQGLVNGGEVYWVYGNDDEGCAKEPKVDGADVVWGPFALSGNWQAFWGWEGMIPASVVPNNDAVWFQKNALEMWVAAGSGREPIVGGVREILKDWGYIQ